MKKETSRSNQASTHTRKSLSKASSQNRAQASSSAHRQREWKIISRMRHQYRRTRGIGGAHGRNDASRQHQARIIKIKIAAAASSLITPHRRVRASVAAPRLGKRKLDKASATHQCASGTARIKYQRVISKNIGRREANAHNNQASNITRIALNARNENIENSGGIIDASLRDIASVKRQYETTE